MPASPHTARPPGNAAELTSPSAGQPRSSSPRLTRRGFLARVGVLGAGAAVLGLAPAGARELASASSSGALDAALEPVVGVARPALQAVAADTIRGLVVMVVPGSDPYSVAQGETSATPGALDARADQFLMDGLDHLLPFPDGVLEPAAAALARGMAEQGEDGSAVPAREVGRLDEALQAVLANEQAVPVTLLVALLLNHLATQVRPSSVAGPFPASPFANLTYVEKAEAWRILEEDTAEVAAAIDADLDEPSRASLSGLLSLLGSALPTYTAFATFSEYGVFDRATLRATARPVGWELSSFQPGRTAPVDGWDELKGYHEGLSTFDADAEVR
jgi:hypothetical protein